MMTEEEQRALCSEYGAEFVEAPAQLKVGIALETLGQVPLNGLRHPPAGDTTGWYIWAGEGGIPDDADFFQPLCVEHLAERCPAALRFLALPPGYRFLTDGEYVDVWYDAQLLEAA